jgi:uncharacterized protein (DUF2384 family)
VPTIFKLDGYNLGDWISKQRQKKDTISPERMERLDNLGFVWDVLIDAWEEGFSKLVLFKNAQGHCRIPIKLKVDGFNLGQWVSVQRGAKDRISPERKQRLDDVGFVWNILNDAWEEGFSKLVLFKNAEGHCRVRQGYTVDGFNLGKWVSHQRAKRHTVDPERKQRLDEIGFIWDASQGKT